MTALLSLTYPAAGQLTFLSPGGYLRVAEEEEGQDRVGSEEVNERAAQAPACQRQHHEASQHQKDGMRKGELAALRCLEGGRGGRRGEI